MDKQRNDKQEDADSVLLKYNKSYPTCVPNFKILSVVVSEKSLRKQKGYAHTNTHKHVPGHSHQRYVETIL